MTEVKVLIEGYAKKLEKGWVASSTTCLITAGNKKIKQKLREIPLSLSVHSSRQKNEGTMNIITDPGCNREKLLEALNKESLTTDDIDYVFLSHCHPDHILLAGIFEKAKFITFDANLMYDKDLMLEFDRHILGKDIEIIETPGHVLEHLSLLVNTPKGKIAVAGDAIWWVDGEKQEFDINQKDHTQAKGMDMKKLIESRKKLLELADWIIPGHGRMFKVKK